MKIAIVINLKRLTPELKAQLASNELTEKHGIDYDVFFPEPTELENTLKKLNYQTYNACLIGGGDGTVRTAAQILAEYNLPLIILPLGTFNVLAKSLDYPNDIDALFGIIKNNKIKKIDVADVNGHTFINHAWLGFYYYIIRLREKHKQTFGRSKLLKALFTTFMVFKRLPTYEFQIHLENNVIPFKTCLLFISNNETSNEFKNLGQRTLLATGLLHVVILDCHNRWQLFCCILSIIFTSLKNSSYITQFSVDELTVTSSNKIVNIVLDGELIQLENPMQFINHKNKLTVMVA